MLADFEKGVKVCYSCKKELPIDTFCKCKSNSDGLVNRCKNCTSIKMKEYQSYNRKKVHNDCNKTKTCSCCKEEKLIDEFCKNKTTTDGFNSYCGFCRKKSSAKNFQKHKELFYKANEKRTLLGKTAEYLRDKRKRDPEFYSLEKLRGWMNKNIGRLNTSKSMKNQELLGCSWVEFHSYIESLFSEDMTWENRGSRKENWNIDHIIPLSYIIQTDLDIRIGLHYLNCRPLWSSENYRKGKKLPENYQEIINNIKRNIYGNSKEI